MSYMDHNVSFSDGIQELTFEEIHEVNGGSDRGTATAGGAVAGATTAAAIMTTATYASYGARIGVVGGAAGILAGAVIGGVIGYAAYTIGR